MPLNSRESQEDQVILAADFEHILRTHNVRISTR
jgi:hypothetical protein